MSLSPKFAIRQTPSNDGKTDPDGHTGKRVNSLLGKAASIESFNQLMQRLIDRFIGSCRVKKCPNEGLCNGAKG